MVAYLKSLRLPWPQKIGDDQNQRGMTLIEIIIVITLIGTLLTILISNIMDKADKAREDQARIGMGTIAQNLQEYRVHNNKYPTTAQGLEALLKDPGDTKRWRGPYVDSEEKLKDPWGNKYEYNSDGRKFQIISGGIDGIIGDADDVKYPEDSADASGDAGAAKPEE